jgi:hypothetical protein
VGKANGIVVVECSGCGRQRSVSARTARRGPGRCKLCLSGDGNVPEADDEARLFWLERFSDEDICELATMTFGRPGSLRRIQAERARLLGAMAAA